MTDENKAIIPGDEIPWALLKQTVNIHAKAGLIPRDTTFEQAMVCAALGHQLGIPRFEALRGIVVVDGKPTLMAGLLSAVVRRSIPSLRIVLVEYERDRCTVKGRRHPDDEWTQITFDWEDAKLAGLTGKKNWQRYPKAMLYARASTILLRMLGPDVIHGVYTPDELGANENPDDGMASATVEQPLAAPREGETGHEGEVIDAPFEGTDEEKRHLSEADELFGRVTGAADSASDEKPDTSTSQDSPSDHGSEPSDETEASPPKKENWTLRARRLADTLKEKGYCKTQVAGVKVLREVHKENKGADDETLISLAAAILVEAAEPAKEPPAEKPQTRQRRKKEEPQDDLESLSDDDLMDRCTDLEDSFTEGRSDEDMSKALDARKAAQDASPNWQTTEERSELLVYARNLKSALDALNAAA